MEPRLLDNSVLFASSSSNLEKKPKPKPMAMAKNSPSPSPSSSSSSSSHGSHTKKKEKEKNVKDSEASSPVANASSTVGNEAPTVATRSTPPLSTPSESNSDGFQLDIRLTKALMKMGLIHPTLVQSKVIPLALQGKDLLVKAKTGSGKTLAYALPLVQKILETKGKTSLELLSSHLDSREGTGLSKQPTSANSNKKKALKGIKALVLVPTRELCAQTASVFSQVLYYCSDVVHMEALLLSQQQSHASAASDASGATYATSSGPAAGFNSRYDGHAHEGKGQYERRGNSNNGNTGIVNESSIASKDILRSRLLNRPDIVIATPGRIASFLKEIDFVDGPMETLVVDEADLVFSYGYAEDLRSIISQLPRGCQSMLMSATINDDVNSLKRVVLHSPAIVRLEEGEDDSTVTQWYIQVKSKEDKDLVLFALLKLNLVMGKTLFFVNNVDRCYAIKLMLDQFGVKAAVLNAELPFNSRAHIIEQFNRGFFDYLIATDESVAISLGGNDTTAAASTSQTYASSDDRKEKSSKRDPEAKNEKKSEADSEDNTDSGDSDDDDDGSNDDGDDDDEMGTDGDVAAKKRSKEDKLKKTENKSQQDATSLVKTEGERRKEPPELESTPSRKRQRGDREFGVARGMDFRGVDAVINVDLPPTFEDYIHRIGRTGRAGANGTALSLVDESELKILKKIQREQGPPREALGSSNSATHLQPPIESNSANADVSANVPTNTNTNTNVGTSQNTPTDAVIAVENPAPLALNLNELERFRYRVRDVRTSITRRAIRDARAKELKLEMINSEKLKEHFQENPADLQLLAHDSTLRISKGLLQVGNVPNYLMPPSLVNSVEATQTQKNRATRHSNKQMRPHRSSSSSKNQNQRMKSKRIKQSKRHGNRKNPLF